MEAEWNWVDAVSLLLTFLFSFLLFLTPLFSVSFSRPWLSFSQHISLLIKREGKCVWQGCHVCSSEGRCGDRRCHILTSLSVSATSWTLLLSPFLSHSISLAFISVLCASAPFLCFHCHTSQLSPSTDPTWSSVSLWDFIHTQSAEFHNTVYVWIHNVFLGCFCEKEFCKIRDLFSFVNQSKHILRYYIIM